ncbi:hypothetical protein GPJ56_010814 [Histomonas meleagridis]|uniref:Uncharacterized protein n=1 Tax=Histomonas meleagridis TaxID=135588 RepID=UPI003559C161|nr:hypothetical protein GPJ56_010814 [Histomonas meleagridis]KAH0801151.1 Uncharacterized protein GO595_006186 [Histomonas meleagridis]
MFKWSEQMNVANTERYKEWQKQYSSVFVPENLQRSDETKLIEGYSVHSKFFQGGENSLSAYENELVDYQGQVIYRWRNLDSHQSLSMFKHRNGNHYLVFQIELYGYSVYELEAGKEMHFVPLQVHPENKKNFVEVFIWTSADYDPNSDLLAVGGCYWACPWSTIVVDFADPLHEQPVEHWLYVEDLIDSKQIDGDVDFESWVDGNLLLNINSENQHKILLPISNIKNALIELKAKDRVCDLI